MEFPDDEGLRALLDDGEAHGLRGERRYEASPSTRQTLASKSPSKPGWLRPSRAGCVGGEIGTAVLARAPFSRFTKEALYQPARPQNTRADLQKRRRWLFSPA